LINSFYDKFIFTNSVFWRNNNFFLMDIPFVMLPTDIITGLISENNHDFNKKIYSIVRNSVKKNLVKEFRLDFKADGTRAVEVVEKYFSFSGWGNIENVQIDAPNARALVNVSNNPFANALLGKAKEPVDHVFRGIFAGLFSAAFEKELDCVETHCLALGEKQCEFVIKQQHEFDVSKKETQNQLELQT